MAQKNQQVDPAVLQKAKNEQAMALGFERPIAAKSQNGTKWGLGQNLSFDNPIVASAMANRITIRHSLKATVSGTATGTVKPTASYPYSLVNQVQVVYGGSVAKFHPYIFGKLNPMIEGYARKGQDESANFKSSVIESMLRSFPTSFTTDGEFDLKWDCDYELNAIHPNSINGLLGIFSTGVRLQTILNMPSQVYAEKADALEHAFEVSGGATVQISGDIEVIIGYRDNVSMTTRQNLEYDTAGLPTPMVIQLPTKAGLSAGVYENVSIQNPYPFVKIFHIICDGKQSDVFSKADNISGYTLNQADNTSSAFLRYDDTVSKNGIVNLYKRTREKFGTDLPEGVIIHSFETDNIANVSSKTGGAFLNLTGEGYPASNFGVMLKSVNNTDRTSKVVSYGIILNGGVQAR